MVTKSTNHNSHGVSAHSVLTTYNHVLGQLVDFNLMTSLLHLSLAFLLGQKIKPLSVAVVWPQGNPTKLLAFAMGNHFHVFILLLISCHQ